MPEITIREKLVFQSKCLQDCDHEVSFKEVSGVADGIVGVYGCSNGHVLRVVSIGERPSRNLFRVLLKKLSSGISIEDKDIKIASRYSWDLGIADDDLESVTQLETSNGLTNNQIFRELYWFMPRLNALGDRIAMFSCIDPGGCGKIFVQDLVSENRLCKSCSQN